jgi:hypothetical protein
MLRWSRAILILFGFSAVLFAAEARADGVSVVVHLTNGKIVTGELLSIREHSILIAEWPGLNEAELDTLPGALLEVAAGGITSIVLEDAGSGHLGLGILLGCFGGGMAGILVAIPREKNVSNSEAAAYRAGAPVQTDDSQSLYIITACTILGGGIGGLIGNSAREDVFVGRSTDDPFFGRLKEYCRYTETEPEFLKDNRPTLVPN